MSDVRKVEVLSKRDNKWKSIPFEMIRKGDVFRMFEPTGEPVMDKSNNHIFIANSDPVVTEGGEYAISIK